MSELSDKLKEPFEQQLNQQLLQLDLANAEMEEHKTLIDGWPKRKKKIDKEILKPMTKWLADLKKVTAPLDLRKYKRARRRLKRFKNIPWSGWTGFRLGFNLAFLWTINLVRILLILSFYISVVAMFGFLLIKLLNFLGGLF